MAPPSQLAASPPYFRHEPERTVLYRAIQENFETFLVAAQKDSTPCSLPSHVYQEVEAYLRCGILAHGFTRLRREACKRERLVAFSCKKRGFCPSCGGKRMNEVAAHLVDCVLPKVRAFPCPVLAGSEGKGDT